MTQIPPEPLVVHVCQTQADREAAMRIRFVVFVDEQNVPSDLEPDEYDAEALHLLCEDQDGNSIGTARIVSKPDGVAKIGRVAVLKGYRGRGVGLILMQSAMREAQNRGLTSAVLDAQLTAIPFYERLGFVAEGPVFDDAGIDHQRMRRPL